MSIKQVLEGFMGFQNIRVICSPPNWYQFTQSLPPTDAKYQNAPYQRSNGHFQMTLLDQRVNITIIFSFYSIYVTYWFRPEDSVAICLLVQKIQGPEICDVNNQNSPQRRSNGHFQMALFDQRVNIKINISFCSIYVTYSLRPNDITAIWWLVQEIQGPEISELSNLA